MFKREFKAIEKLKSEQLFQNCLQPDILAKYDAKKNNDVFPAIRDNRVDFYHKGGKLFSYNATKGFTTHHKYASVIRANRNSYVTDENLEAVSSFEEGYVRIKENCSLYSGIEAWGVSRLSGRYSFAKQRKPLPEVLILDVEVSLKRQDDEDIDPEPQKATRSDRLDLVLLDTSTGLLRFFEAKDFSNGEIRAKEGNTPKIVGQIDRYRRQLQKDSVRQEILSAYANYARTVNELFGTKVPEPQTVDPEPRLLVFGFDKPQLDTKLKKEVKTLESEFGLSVYAIGSIDQAIPENIFVAGRKKWDSI